MHSIPKPELLDPHRMLTDDRDDFTITEHRTRANRLAAALQDSCDYAQALWQQLDEVRGYLVRCLPDDPQRAAENHGARRPATAPTGPDDDAGWDDWMATYAAVTSMLCGPHGDSGFGADEARREARARRVAPVPVEPAAPAPVGEHPQRRRRWWERLRRRVRRSEPRGRFSTNSSSERSRPARTTSPSQSRSAE